MSESFLSRWSRRKRENTSPSAEPDSDAPRRSEDTAERAAATSPRLRGEVGSRSDPGEGASPPAEHVERAPHPNPLPASGEREFDPATLPPIASIDAGTDVSAFLRPGVPADLARAALRRAWATDPAIRDFVGLAENAWDFNKPGGVPGFEPLRAIDDVQRLLTQVAGALPMAAPENATAEEAESTPTAAQPEPAPLAQDAEPTEPADVATQNEEASAAARLPLRPRHGGALAE
jgi:Protein of unknown function (DUF3306)